ncbi:hypothetical protein chiPu_0011708 [Chiloscyllium punctatum]|uniref:Uncharacterized protein n=1 Tax=Chiloscyllium punctatum TaxID=137246 RepID=A0A401SS65_CHIPU|nr:hypothetical protein [Chiloscyllium punctatum]
MVAIVNGFVITVSGMEGDRICDYRQWFEMVNGEVDRVCDESVVRDDDQFYDKAQLREMPTGFVKAVSVDDDRVCDYSQWSAMLIVFVITISGMEDDRICDYRKWFEMVTVLVITVSGLG